jgi:hypothetical protein
MDGTTVALIIAMMADIHAYIHRRSYSYRPIGGRRGSPADGAAAAIIIAMTVEVHSYEYKGGFILISPLVARAGFQWMG